MLQFGSSLKGMLRAVAFENTTGAEQVRRRACREAGDVQGQDALCGGDLAVLSATAHGLSAIGRLQDERSELRQRGLTFSFSSTV